MKFTANEIAEQVGGEAVGDGNIELAGFAQADVAKPGDLTFAEMEPAEKDAISHRAVAFSQLIAACFAEG